MDQLIRYRAYPDNNPATAATVDYTYAYGPLGRRWSKQNTLAAGATQFYWSGANLIGENNNGVERRYLLEGVTLTGFVENGETYHYLKDHLGTAHEIADESGDTLWQGDYTSFGEVAKTINLVDNNLRFAGQYEDRESGLYYNYYRYYDPDTGRYITSDPIGLAGGINTYAYVGNNPLMYADPLGLWSLGIEAYAGIGGGVNISYSNGTLEVTGRLGVGIGGGASFDPDGTPSPHSQDCGSGYIARTSWNASAGVGVGPFGVGGSATLAVGNAVTTPVGGGYTSVTDLGSISNSRSMGVRIGVSGGVDIGSYTNW